MFFFASCRIFNNLDTVPTLFSIIKESDEYNVRMNHMVISVNMIDYGDHFS